MQISTVQWFLKTCVVSKQRLEDFDDKCIILIQLFGGYSVSEVLNAKVAGRMLGVACHMQRHSFLFERECSRLQQETVKVASGNIIPWS